MVNTNSELKNKQDYSIQCYEFHPEKLRLKEKHDKNPNSLTPKEKYDFYNLKDKMLNRMHYVHKIDDYIKYINKDPKTCNWDYINIYARRTNRFLERIYK